MPAWMRAHARIWPVPRVVDAIATARLSLRPLVEGADDLALYRALYCDPGVMLHVAEPVPGTRVVASFEASCRDSASAPAFASRWCVRRSRDGEGVGLLGAFHDRPSSSVELGILLLPQAQGSGFAVEALAAMMATLHGSADAAWFWSRHRPANRAMARVLERLDFARGPDRDGHWRWQRPAVTGPR